MPEQLRSESKDLGEAAADLAFPTRGRLCVEKSGILVSQPSPLGKGDRAAVDRVLS